MVVLDRISMLDEILMQMILKLIFSWGRE